MHYIITASLKFMHLSLKTRPSNTPRALLADFLLPRIRYWLFKKVVHASKQQPGQEIHRHVLRKMCLRSIHHCGKFLQCTILTLHKFSFWPILFGLASVRLHGSRHWLTSFEIVSEEFKKNYIVDGRRVFNSHLLLMLLAQVQKQHVRS